MKTVTLCLRDREQREIDTVTGSFEDVDLELLRQFIEHVTRVRASALLVRGLPAITDMQWNPETGEHKFKCEPITDDELHALLHTLRPVILQKEQASFQKVAALLNRRFKDRRFAEHVRFLRRLFEDGRLGLYMQVSVAGQKLFDESLLHLYLNGVQYHVDPEKAQAWKALETALQAENARAVVTTQLNSKVQALFGLEYLASLVVQKATAIPESAQ